MGCWNNTCTLTNLPIMAREKVYIYPIFSNFGNNSMCGNMSLYSPSMIPFMGDYNDYGAAENCHGEIDFNMAMIKKRLVEVDQGENPYHDIEVKKDKFDLDLFFKASGKGRLKCDNYGRQAANVSFAMIREDAVNYLMKNWKFDVYTGVGDGYDHNVTYGMYDMELVLYVDYVMDYHKNNIPSLFFKFPQHDNHRVSREFSYITGSSGWAWAYDVLNYVTDCVGSGDKGKLLEIMTLMLKSMMINDYMGHIRKIWLPVTHMGSQSQEFDEYRLFNKMTNDIVEKMDYRDEYDD